VCNDSKFSRGKGVYGGKEKGGGAKSKKSSHDVVRKKGGGGGEVFLFGPPSTAPQKGGGKKRGEIRICSSYRQREGKEEWGVALRILDIRFDGKRKEGVRNY